MIRRNQQKLVLPLVACLLLVPALASPASVAHEAQHAHHNAATHSSPLCSWLCGAGQGFNLADSVFVPTISFLAILAIASVFRVDYAPSVFSPPRGPPAAFLT
jgi:hypothetical protein